MTENDQMKVAEARFSDAGKPLMEAQFSTVWNITEIVRRTIERQGRFKDVLRDYSRAFADSEKNDAVRAEFTVRDIYAVRYGEEMKDTLQRLKSNEEQVRKQGLEPALEAAHKVLSIIQDGETRPFYLAFDAAANDMAEHFTITEVAAKSLMKEAYEQATGLDLYDTGKALEKQYHEPKREEARQARDATKSQSRSRAPSMQP